MKRKCRGCDKTKKVKYRECLGEGFYCSKECLYRARNMEPVINIRCAVCNKTIGGNSILKHDRDSFFQKFYCSDGCMLIDLHIIKEDN